MRGAFVCRGVLRQFPQISQIAERINALNSVGFQDSIKINICCQREKYETTEVLHLLVSTSTTYTSPIPA